MLVLAKQTTNNFKYKIILTWSSDFFALTGYNVLNLQKEYCHGNQIKTYLFERLKTKKIAASTRKKAERKNVTFRFGRCQSTPPIMWIYFLQVLPFGNL